MAVRPQQEDTVLSPSFEGISGPIMQLAIIGFLVIHDYCYLATIEFKLYWIIYRILYTVWSVFLSWILIMKVEHSLEKHDFADFYNRYFTWLNHCCIFVPNESKIGFTVKLKHTVSIILRYRSEYGFRTEYRMVM